MDGGMVSIVLPVYNQADHLREVVEEYAAALASLPRPWEIILVPNGCWDQSSEIARGLALGDQRIQCVECSQAGWGAAVLAGIAAADGNLICYTNLARTRAPDLVLSLLYAIANPDTVIKADRKIRENWRRRLGSLLYNLECRALFDLSYWDINGTPKVFPRSMERLMSLRREDDLIDLEFNVVCRVCEYRMLQVPLLSARRHGGRSTTNLRSAWRMYSGAYRMARSFKNGELFPWQ